MYQKMVFASSLQGGFFSSILRAALLTTIFVFVFTVRPVWSQSTSPCLNTGSKWRIAYYEGGHWPDYKTTLLATISALMKMGWIEHAPLPQSDDQTDTAEIWNWLATHARSDYLIFPATGYYSAGWDEDQRQKNQTRLIQELAQGRYDLVWALGTWAGLDMVNDKHHVPTMVMSTSNPVTAGIIPSPEDSGFDHVHVRTDPTRVLRQVLLFHDIFAFSRLGIIYQDSNYGRGYAYLDEVKDAAAQADFELVTCEATNAEGATNYEESVAEYVSCAKKLAPVVDAFLYDDHTCAVSKEVGRTLPIFIKSRIPTWSIRGSSLVQRGVLMSTAKKDFILTGQFYADTMARILNGASPGDIEQVFRESFRLALNLKTAELIGYTPPPNLLMVTDDLYTTISPQLGTTNEQ